MRKTVIGVTTLAIVGGLAVTGLTGPSDALAPASAATTASSAGWLGTWGTSMSRGSVAAAGTRAHDGFSNVTFRQDVRLTAGGSRLRVRLSNQFGDRTITFGAVAVAQANSNGDPVPGTTRDITFGGKHSVAVAKGTSQGSDPVTFSAPSNSQVVVSYYVPGATGPTTFHHVTKERVSYGSGNQTHSNTRLSTNDGSYFLNQVDVQRSEANVGTVIAVGDSITDGVFNKPGEHYSYYSQMPFPNWLGRRILSDGHGKVRGTVNAGLAGDQLLVSGKSLPSGTARLYTEVIYRPNVKTVVVLLGTNDIIMRADHGTTGTDIYNGMKNFVAVAHSHGISVIGSTIPPNGAGPSSSTGVARENARNSFNSLVRSRSPFDCNVDFAKLLADPSRPNKMIAKYDSGDHIHPNAAGYKAMAYAIPISCIR